MKIFFGRFALVASGLLAFVGLSGCMLDSESKGQIAPAGPRIDTAPKVVEGGPQLVIELSVGQELVACSADPRRHGACTSLSASGTSTSGVRVALPPRVVEQFDGRNPYGAVPNDGQSWVVRLGCPSYKSDSTVDGRLDTNRAADTTPADTAADLIEVRVQLVELDASGSSLTSIVQMGNEFDMVDGILGGKAPYLDIECRGDGAQTAVYVLHLATDGVISVFHEPLPPLSETSGTLN